MDGDSMFQPQHTADFERNYRSIYHGKVDFTFR